jgi:hypothetical protein
MGGPQARLFVALGVPMTEKGETDAFTPHLNQGAERKAWGRAEGRDSRIPP